MKREKVENSYAEPGNMGGLVSTIVSLPTTIKNCIVTSENRTKEISGNQNLGGLIGFCNSEIKIENTEFSNMIIKSSTTDGNQTGGAIGVNGGNANIKGLRINNIKIDSPGGIGGVWGCQNREATIEIAKQLRLRDIGGIIIIDYIDMQKQENKENIEKLLREELKKDRSKTQVEGFTKLDLMELTRKHICSHKD